MASHPRRITIVLLCTVMVFLLPILVSAGSSFPVPHTPKPSSPYTEFHAPDAYPFTYRGWFDVSIDTNFTIPPGEFDTQANIERNTPFLPFTKDKNVFMYFGPNKLGSVQLLNQGGCRLTPDKQVWTPYDLGSRLDYWHWRYEYDWSLVNYWYDVAISWATYCWPGGCWTSSDGKSSYCWSGGCSTYATDWNYYEVYYWTKGSFLRKVKQPEFKFFPIRMEIGRYWDPIKKVWVKIYKYYNAPETGEFTRVTPVGLEDHSYNFTAEIMDFVFSWYQYTYSNPLKKVSHFLQSFVHPLPPVDPVWSMTADNIWRDKIDDTKVKLNFRWGKPSPNRNEEQYYIEYGKLFDGKIKGKLQRFRKSGGKIADLKSEVAAQAQRFEPRIPVIVTAATDRIFKGLPTLVIEQLQKWFEDNGLRIDRNMLNVTEDRVATADLSGSEMPDLLQDFSRLMAGVLSAIVGVVTASVCGGGGTALLMSGPIGWLIGLVLGAAVAYLATRYGMEAARSRAEALPLPAWTVRLAMRESSIDSARGKLRTQTHDQVLAELEKLQSRLNKQIEETVDKEIEALTELHHL
ncbi:MAG: hypothetical protein GX442_08310 [Candidatus Riflebacteria bacterium]|nr:hypothetical protein [Candidatus Riflebacteria bacterium]